MLYITSPDYLQAMGIRLVKGRFFTAQDTQKSPRVAVIDETFARQQFPDQEALGQHLAGDGKDNPDAEIHLLDAGHFALESQGPEIAAIIRDFLARKLPKQTSSH